MMTLEEYKATKTKNKVNPYISENTYWDHTIDESIDELKKIQAQYPNDTITMELGTTSYEYDHNDYPCINFHITREETDEEFNERINHEYEYYVKKEKYDLETYERMKKKFEEK